MTYEDLQPQKIFSYFKLLSDIPRSSGNEAAAAKFVLDTATKLGHKASMDTAGNVLVLAEASAGYEAHEPIMLQGHLDMVCEANSEIEHDFLKDPIKLILDGDILHADGTTLGADNGVAVAIMLAVLDSDIPHPPLECLFTTEEETGLVGMQKFDASVIKSRRMINIDSAEDGIATASCAGGVRSCINFPLDFEAVPSDYNICSMTVSGLFGGHSGEDIHRGRTGAISAGARILYAASKVCDIRISTADGGCRDNAIPREFSAVAAVSDYLKFENAVKIETEKIRGELVEDDFGFDVKLTSSNASKFLSKAKSLSLICLLRTLPMGVRSMSRVLENLVETSSNLASVATRENNMKIVVSSRSSISSKLDDMENLIEAAVNMVNATVEHVNRYPAWDYTSDSPLQKLYLDSYRRVFKSDAKIHGIHAGLECGYLKNKIPSMDMISIGPDLKNLHSPDESMSVSSFARLWDLICDMLNNA